MGPIECESWQESSECHSRQSRKIHQAPPRSGSEIFRGPEPRNTALSPRLSPNPYPCSAFRSSLDHSIQAERSDLRWFTEAPAIAVTSTNRHLSCYYSAFRKTKMFVTQSGMTSSR